MQIVQVGVFKEFSGTEFTNFLEVAEKLRSDYDFGHTLSAKHLPRGDAAVASPLVRLFKPFDELVVDSKVILCSLCKTNHYLSVYFSCCHTFTKYRLLGIDIVMQHFAGF